MLAVLEEIAEGQILIGERMVNDVHRKDRNIAMVIHSYALYPRMGIFENMAFSLMLKRVDKQETKRRVEGVAGCGRRRRGTDGKVYDSAVHEVLGSGAMGAQFSLASA